MKYKNLYFTVSYDDNVIRKDKNGEDISCEGFRIEIFADPAEQCKLDSVICAVDFEILSRDTDEAVAFAKEVIDQEEKTYVKMIQETKLYQ